MPPASGHLREGAHPERSLPVVHQDAHPVGMGVQDQIGPTVSVEIGGRHARHIATQGLQSLREGLLGDVLKAPVAPVAPQRGTAAGGPEQHIQQPVPIHVGQSDPGSIEQQLIREMPCSRNGVGEGDARSGGFEAQEASSRRGSLCSKHRSRPAEDQPANPGTQQR